MNHLDEIRAKINIEELVGGYLQLKKAGRNLKGLCPFHNDSRPSFMVSPEKGIAYCFACNTGGDIFKFIQLIEKVDFPEAVKILADKAGVKLPEYKPEAEDEKKRLIKANEISAGFFADKLKESATAANYFKSRGLPEETIEAFQLGFAPDSYSNLKDHLLSRGFGEKELLNGGPLNQRSIADQNTYDRFRNRVIFPITDHLGSVVGFGGRILEESELAEGGPKYLNSPDTPVYNKSYVLYGLHLAKEFIKKEDLAIFVEGYMDVITAHQAGSQNVIATSGTALTSGQLKLIKRYTKNIALAFDQDSAGMEATRRAIELAKEAELNIKIIMIPNGKDPDDCIRESKEAWFEAVKKAVPAMDFYFSHAFRLYDKTKLDDRKAILELLLPIIRLYPTSMEQNEYLTRLAFELKTDVKFLWEDIKNSRFRADKKNQKTPVNGLPTGGQGSQLITRYSREEFLLGFIFNDPQFYPLVHDNLIDTASFDPGTEKIYKALKNMYDSRSVIQPEDLQGELSGEDYKKLEILSLLVEEDYPDLPAEKTEKEILSLTRNINRKNIHSTQKEYEYKIRMASDPGERTILLNQYNQILKLSSKLS